MTNRLLFGLARSRDDRVVAGVCGGLARSWHVDPLVVRFGALTLVLAGGVGVVAYLAAWALLPVATGLTADEPTDRRDDLALGAIVIGAVLVLRAAGLWVGDGVAVVAAAAVIGLTLVLGPSRTAGRTGPAGAVRIAIGLLLVMLGLTAFAAGSADLRAVGRSLLGAVVLAAGTALLTGPRAARLARELSAERRARRQSEQRAEIAAHLHDGVLQTLSLIQHRADGNREVFALARRQERELRAWLYGGDAPVEGTLAAALQRALAEVEDTHGLPVELVCVGDALLTETTAAVVAAVREAALNAVVHSGGDRVDVYVEVDGRRLSAFVRDRGRGFDPDAVPAGRGGLAGSVIGRVQRIGGQARVRTGPGEGTEVAIEVELAAP